VLYFELIDLFAINAYIELGNYASLCSQFVIWGSRTVDGNTIAARNMDGEIDIRKITVSHLTIFSVSPSETNQNKFISIMWPGFIGTLTGFNEHGLYGMMNTGVCDTGVPVQNAQPVSWSMRAVLQSLTAETATPENTLQTLSQYRCSGGGISTSGTIFVYARNNTAKTGPLGYVFEGDKYNSVIRVPGEVDPMGSDEFIMATNHFMVYGVDPFLPQLNFGKPDAFGSLVRYSTGALTLSAWERVDQKADVRSMQDILQRVCRGFTEHSVIWTPHDRKFYVANSQWKPTLWDAPYETWVPFVFDDLFKI